MDGFNPCPNVIQLDGKLHEIWSQFSGKLLKIVATIQMSYFEAKMHQIPDPLAGI